MVTSMGSDFDLHPSRVEVKNPLIFTSMPLYAFMLRCSEIGGNLETFTALIFQVKVFWVVTPYSVVVGCQRFGGLYCFHLQGEGSGSDVSSRGLLCCDAV
jgi:hypothetical protein